MRNLAIFVGILTTIALASGQNIGPKVWPLNGHSYTYIGVGTIQKTYEEADTYCKSIGSYIVTVTSAAEYQFIKDNFNMGRVWMAGFQYTSGVWTYDQGPEVNTTFYNAFEDRCFTHCPWDTTGYPKVGEIKTDNVVYDLIGKAWRNDWSFLSSRVICEKGGMDAPYIAPQPTEGGLAKIGNVFPNATKFDYSKTKVTMVSVSDPSQVMDCPVVQGTNLASNLSCMVPPGTGSWNVTVSDGTFSASTLYFYQPPHIQAVFPASKSGDSLTIIGQNFGKTSDKMSVTLGTTTTASVQCNSFVSIANDTISCTLAGDAPATLYPISVTKNGINSTFQRAPTHAGNFVFYSAWKIKAPFQLMTRYTSQHSLEGMLNKGGVVKDANVYSFLTKTFIATNLWMNAVANGSSPTCSSYLSFGELTGQPATLYNPNNINLCTAVAPKNYITFNFTGPVLESQSLTTTSPSGEINVEKGILTEFLIPRPVIKSDTRLNIPTSGGVVTLTGMSGIIFAPTTLSFNGIDLQSTMKDKSSAIFTIPEGYGVHTATLTVNGLSNLPGQYKITVEYDPPTITSVTTSSTKGDVITITGSNLANDASVSSAILEGLPAGGVCSGITVQTAHTTLTCTMPPGYGSGMISVNIGGQKSNSIAITYMSPTVTSFTANGTIFQITGTNFYTDSTVLSVTIGSIVCGDVSITTAETLISCSISKPGAGSHTVTVKLGGLSGSSTNKYTFTPVVKDATAVYYKKGGVVTIVGDSFDPSNLLITIGGGPCTEPTIDSQQKMTCNFAGEVEITDNKSLYVNVTVDSHSGGDYVFLYTPSEAKCPGDPIVCSGHGLCLEYSGQCKCDPGWQVVRNCSIPGGSGGDPSTGGNGTTIYPGSGFNFTTSVSHLREVTPEGVTVQTLVLTTAAWTLVNGTLTSEHQDWSANFTSNPAIVLMTVSLYSQDTTIYFAGEPLEIGANSIKYTVTINAWNFSSPLNSLQVIYSTRALKETKSECDSNVDTSSENFFNEYQIVAGASVLRARFASRLIADGRAQYSKVIALAATDELVFASVKTDSQEITVMTAIVVPHFSTSAVVDPSFRSLVRTGDEDSNCSKNKWRVPVIVTGAVVGGLAVVAAIGMVIRMNIVKRAGRLERDSRLSRM
eukprot:gene8364-9824_t